MTLFSLLFIMAIERVTQKSAKLHIATIANQYFDLLIKKQLVSSNISMPKLLAVTAVPAVVAYIVIESVPGLVVLLINLLVLWVCIGCPVTRQTYKRYLHAAHKEDFQACALYSMSFGNSGDDLDNVAKQLVLVNYRQYAAVVIVFILAGVPGVIFYSLAKEWLVYEAKLKQADDDTQGSEAELNDSHTSSAAAQKLLFILDFIPVRITALGFLIVGNFSHALTAWFDVMTSTKISAYDALAKVAVAAEDVSNCDTHMTQPLRLVRLVKRNIIFILVALSLATLVGLVA